MKTDGAMYRVLVVAADPAVRSSLSAALASAGYDVESASSSAGAVAIARTSKPDVLVLDLPVPGIGAVDLVHELRRDCIGLPAVLIALMAASTEEDHVPRFEAGFDDFVIKPYTMRELVLRVRVRSLARKRGNTVRLGMLRVGSLCIDVDARHASSSGRPVVLTRREFDALSVLARHAGRVMTRECLVEQIWGEVECSTRIVDTTIKRLRRKLAATGCNIKTLRGVGYRLVADEA